MPTSPLVSLDLNLAVAVAQIDQVRKLAKDRFTPAIHRALRKTIEQETRCSTYFAQS